MRLFFLGLTLMFLALPACAQVQQQRNQCFFGSTATYDQQIADCTALIYSDEKAGVNPAEAYDRRGLAYDSKLLHDLAMVDFNKAIALKPNDAHAYIDRGTAYDDANLLESAIADYTKAIALEPNNALPYAGRSWEYHRKGQELIALSDANKAIALNPKESLYIETRAEIYARLGRRDEAIADFRMALRLEPNMKGAIIGLRHLGLQP